MKCQIKCNIVGAIDLQKSDLVFNIRRNVSDAEAGAIDVDVLAEAAGLKQRALERCAEKHRNTPELIAPTTNQIKIKWVQALTIKIN